MKENLKYILKHDNLKEEKDKIMDKNSNRGKDLKENKQDTLQRIKESNGISDQRKEKSSYILDNFFNFPIV